jgi:RND family efflux transporter MFP subunit
MNANVDLRQLAVRRDETTPHLPARRPKHLVSRYLLPATVLLGFLAVLGWSARESLLPSRPVTVVPVLTTRASAQQGGTPLFQAAGWVEPRPTSVLVTALADGVIDQLLVVEGQEVTAGEPVARLIDVEARLAVQAAEADLRLRRADLAGAKAAVAAARTNAAQPAHLRAALAEAEAMLAQKETELSDLPFQLQTAEARLLLARAHRDRLGEGYAKNAVPERSYQEAENELKAATASVDALKAREPRLRREVEAQRDRRNAMRQRLELKTEETRQLAEAGASVEAAEARVELARVTADSARLRLGRMIVRAPVSGRVLAVVARPGARLMGLTPGSLHDSSTVVSLYDPARLQVRADVRLEDVPRVRPGQPVLVETPAAPGGPLEGEVLFATSQADIQKNTLQVKVAIKDPPPTLRPDMLVQVTFLAPASPQNTDAGSEPLRLLVPRQLVEFGDGSTRVWVAEQAAGVARQKPVKLGQAGGDLVEVVEGLNAGDRLIVSGREGLRDGQRITVTGEEVPAGARPNRMPRGGE